MSPETTRKAELTKNMVKRNVKSTSWSGFIWKQNKQMRSADSYSKPEEKINLTDSPMSLKMDLGHQHCYVQVNPNCGYLHAKISFKEWKMPPGSTQLRAAKWFGCFCIVCGFEEENVLENLNSVLFCLIKKCFVWLLCFWAAIKVL